jgi:hypothetical protein
MADRFYSCEFGTTMKSGVTEAGSTTASADVELRVTYDATNNRKNALLMAIDAIQQKILEDTWPPA